MNVVHVSTTDVQGGAARAAYRLHEGLDRYGVSSSMYVLNKSSDAPTVERFIPPPDLPSRIGRRVRQWRIDRDAASYASSRPQGLEPFSDDRTQYAAQPADALPDCDVVNLHWIANFIDIGAFLDATSVPVVWTLHDQNAFTGGCHYDAGCRKHQAQCGACPQLGSSASSDLSAHVWKRKRDAYTRSRDRLHVVTPSEWLAASARQSSLFGDVPVSVIPYGLDTDVFAPHDGTGLREALGIRPDERAVLFVAASTQNRRKGFPLLLDALRGLDPSRTASTVHLISVGNHAPEVGDAVAHHHLGKVTNNRLLALIYSAADLFVIPSLQDNLPNTVLESLACGTPIVGFDAGGIPDMVRPEDTGWLAQTGDVTDLRDTITEALSDDARLDRMSTSCRRTAVKEYALERQAERYESLYLELLT